MQRLVALSLIALGATALAPPWSRGVEAGDEWMSKIRRDHPRLFFNKDIWPQVKARALGAEKVRYEKVKWWAVDKHPDNPEVVRDWGPAAADTAFVYLMTGDRRCLEKSKKMLQLSIAHYQKRFAERRAVDWTSTTRVCALVAYDWLYNDLTPEERKQILLPLLQHIEDMQPGPGKPRIQRVNHSDHTTGFYGEENLLWFAGLAGYQDGIDDQRAERFLRLGYQYNQDLLEFRKQCAGDDGGTASGTIMYALVHYPWSEFNFFHTWRSATGENLASKWPHLAYFPVWVMWNWIPAPDGPKEFGFGDAPHYTNDLRCDQLFGHMTFVMNFYGQSHPELAGLAAHIRSMIPETHWSNPHEQRQFSWTWPMWPFLMTDVDQAPPPKPPAADQLFARHFEALGQIFMRSGTGLDDTYCLYTIGSRLRAHKHYDENNFVIYKNGFLALDTGTRGNEGDFNLRHYYAQSVAHNCVLIHQPGEPFADYWGEECHDPEGKSNYGGMNRTAGGGKVAAFETNHLYTYVAGDATGAYSNAKCALALRQFVFVMPDWFVICDRVTSTRPEYRKEWLLHTQEEPSIEGNLFRADEGQGRLFCRTLLPKDACLSKVGGPGKEFWAHGRNWELNKWVRQEAERIRQKTGKPMLWGNWRIEVRPGAPRADDVFLHLIQVGNRSLPVMTEAQLLEAEGTVGVTFQAGEKSVRVVFGTAGHPSGHIRIAAHGTTLMDQQLATDVMPQAGIGSPDK